MTALAKRVIIYSVTVTISIGIWAALGMPTAGACDTPVYRYAMYNWPPAPYRVFYYHHGEPAEADQQVNRTLEKLAGGEPAANVLVQPVDVSKTEQFEQYPKPVIDAWRAHGSDNSTLHVVFSPTAAELFHGRLEAAAVEAMVDSPARKRVGELLHQGNAVVWLILSGPDADENARAEKAVKEVVAAAAAGKLETDADAAASPSPAQTPADKDEAAQPKGLKAGVLTVSRTDPAETWLVRSLLAVEPDLDKLTAEPMVFAVCGRGRAMPPCVGKGITAENLIDCLTFLSGPCSCMIKDQNPGADLLMRWDWDATAEAMAAEEEQQMNPGLPDDRQPAPAAASGPTVVASTEGSAPSSTDAVTPTVSQASDKPADAAETPAAQDQDSAKPADATEASGQDQTVVSVSLSPQSFAARLAWKIGIGLAVGGVLVVTAGLVLLRLQRRG